MQSAEDILPKFLESVFKRINNESETFILEDSDDAETDDNKFLSEFKKKVNLISIALKFIHHVHLKLFFDVMLLSKRNIFTLISSHCFKMCDDIDNIFFAFIYTCSYVNFVLYFCEEKGLEEFSKLNCMCTQEIFVYRLKEDFEAQGSWAGLENFTLANNLPEYIDFFCDCFTDNTKMFTPLTIAREHFGYGIHNNSMTNSSREVFAVLERVIILSYHKEFEADSQYLVEVLSSFKKVRATLDEQFARNQALNSESLNQVQGQRVNISHIHVTLKSSRFPKKRRRRR